MVKVDEVYQKVLALANKEQRGYITPQEFNLFARLAQMEIFEQYFYDQNQRARIGGNDSELYDVNDMLEEKLDYFRQTVTITSQATIDYLDDKEVYMIGDAYLYKYPAPGVHWWDKNNSLNMRYAEKVKQSDLIYMQSSPLTRATNKRPVYYISGDKIKFIPETAPEGFEYHVRFIHKPKNPNWTYLKDPTTQNALYNPDAIDHQDFELHTSEEPKLVTKILQLAGVNMKDPNLVQLATQKEIGMVQQQKQ